MRHSIGIDLGTTNVKAVLVAANGTVIASTARALTSGVEGDTVEQDPEAIWRLVIDSITELTSLRPTEARSIESIGVCSQYSSIVGVDATGRPTSPLIMWSDQRGSDYSWAIISEHDTAFDTWVQRHGIPPVGGGLSLAHILHLQFERPETHAATTAYVEAMDYVTARLTSRITSTQQTAFMTQLCDNRTLGNTHYDADLVAMSGVDSTRLPALIEVESVVAPIVGEIAETTGLPAGVVVAAGTNDTATVAVATGALESGIGGLAIGTTSVLIDTVESFSVDLDHEIVSMPGPFGDSYLTMAENGLGGRVLEHTIDHIVHPDDILGSNSHGDPFSSVDIALSATSPAAGDVMFLPWLAGSLAPNSSHAMRGGFINMSLETVRVDLIRSVAEGVAHNLAWLLPHVEALSGNRVDQINFTGGGARSKAWVQVIADVLGRPVAVVAQPHLATARAAALLSLQRCGAITRTDLAAAVEIGPVHDPATRHRALYDHRQSQFEACFEALLPIHTALGGTP